MTKAAAAEGEIRYRVTGMDCAACATKIDTAIRRVPGVTDVTVSVAAGRMTVRHDSVAAPEAEIERGVTGLGYGLSRDAPADTGAPVPETAAPVWWKIGKLHLTVASGAALAFAYGLATLMPSAASWFYVAAVAVGLIPIARRAFAAAFAGSPFSIEMLMTIAAIGAIVIGAGEEAAAVVFLFLVGELLEGVAAARARASIKGLITLIPKNARREQDGRITEIPAEQLAIGDRILVRPGDRVPADGVIVTGDGSVDEAPITGEATPKRKGEGDRVFAGTINLDGALSVRVTAAAADNTIARIVRLVEEAQDAKAPPRAQHPACSNAKNGR